MGRIELQKLLFDRLPFLPSLFCAATDFSSWGIWVSKLNSDRPKSPTSNLQPGKLAGWAAMVCIWHPEPGTNGPHSSGNTQSQLLPVSCMVHTSRAVWLLLPSIQLVWKLLASQTVSGRSPENGAAQVVVGRSATGKAGSASGQSCVTRERILPPHVASVASFSAQV